MSELSRIVLLVAVIAGIAACAGCSWGPSTSQLTVRSLTSPGHAVLAPVFEAGVYRAGDQNTADIYLTDIPLGRVVEPSDALADVEGTILHVHLFVVPEAGKTPIDATACNATVRHTVLSRGAVGVYGGGGFFYPSGDPGDAELGGTIATASLRLQRASRDFNDLLGSALAEGTVRARLDEQTARRIAARLDAIASATPPVPARTTSK